MVSPKHQAMLFRGKLLYGQSGIRIRSYKPRTSDSNTTCHGLLRSLDTKTMPSVVLVPYPSLGQAIDEIPNDDEPIGGDDAFWMELDPLHKHK